MDTEEETQKLQDSKDDSLKRAMEAEIDMMAEEKLELSDTEEISSQEQLFQQKENTKEQNQLHPQFPLQNIQQQYKTQQLQYTQSRAQNPEPVTASEFNKLFPDGFHIYHIDSKQDKKTEQNKLIFYTLRRNGFQIDLNEMDEKEIQQKDPIALTGFLIQRFKRHYYDKIQKDFEFKGKFCLDDVI